MLYYIAGRRRALGSEASRKLHVHKFQSEVLEYIMFHMLYMIYFIQDVIYHKLNQGHERSCSLLAKVFGHAGTGIEPCEALKEPTNPHQLCPALLQQGQATKRTQALGSALLSDPLAQSSGRERQIHAFVEYSEAVAFTSPNNSQICICSDPLHYPALQPAALVEVAFNLPYAQEGAEPQPHE